MIKNVELHTMPITSVNHFEWLHNKERISAWNI